jgi:hypothetical protein
MKCRVSEGREGRNVEEWEYLTLQAIMDSASQTVLRVNKEPQSPELMLCTMIVFLSFSGSSAATSSDQRIVLKESGRTVEEAFARGLYITLIVIFYQCPPLRCRTKRRGTRGSMISLYE